MNSRRFAFYARRALWIIIAWVAFAIGVFFYDYITLVSNRALTSNYDFISSFNAYLIVAVCAGVIGGTLTVNLMEYWLRKYRFWMAMLLIIIIYTVIAILVGSIGALYLSGPEMGLPMFRQEAIEELLPFYKEPIFVKNYFIWLILVLLTLVFLVVSDRFGPGVLPNYLLGKYFKPKKENRIFMFSDIKNATSIAEQLGEEQYFQFLKAFFRVISPAISEYRGEIYQYVGDEIVLTWKVKKNKKNIRSLHCFYRMNRLILLHSAYFKKTFGVIPEFKWGFHCGNTVVGEIGEIKRDIAFSGDVLNTAARIQGKCNELEVRILASEGYLHCIEPLPRKITSLPLGEQNLKGKLFDVPLVTFRNDN